MEDPTNNLMEDEMMIKRTRMRQALAVRTRGETIPIISIIKTIEIKEEEEEDKDQEEEASMEHVFTLRRRF